MRRGACPSLSAPMPTGDGLLVRLNPMDGSIAAAQLAGVARAGTRFGNGLLEITARGSLQIRGLSAASASRFAGAVAALGIEAAEGVEVRTGALAGLDAAELADPRPMASDLRSTIRAAGLSGRVAPKMSITVDGGGVLPLDGLVADLRLRVVRWGETLVWSLQAGTVAVGAGDAGQVVAGAVAVLELLADRGRQARGKDLSEEECAAVAASLRPWDGRAARIAAPLPVGPFVLRRGKAFGFVPAFGQISAADLEGFCSALPDTTELRLAPGRGLLVIDGDGVKLERESVMAGADGAGLVSRPDDVRLKIASCAGAPGCASAWLDTKRLSVRVSEEAPALLREIATLHVSGCGKGCAKPAGPAVSVIGGENGATVAVEGTACDPRLAASLQALAQSAVARPKMPA